ncbi:hypothetical protein BaRGS_00035985 [Batillaria attramentaria]|uniref:Uncharacterized protein n=1 Tax=Batillaria attramentaria TaxID=370345 RepID=A0ABD0JD31_9CAEN
MSITLPLALRIQCKKGGIGDFLSACLLTNTVTKMKNGLSQRGHFVPEELSQKKRSEQSTPLDYHSEIDGNVDAIFFFYFTREGLSFCDW